MKKQMKNMLAVVSVLAVAGSASAALWTGGAVDGGHWGTPGNWDTGVPVAGEATTIDTVGAVIHQDGGDTPSLGATEINNGTVYTWNALQVGPDLAIGRTGTGAINVPGGSGTFDGWTSVASWGLNLAEGGGNGTLINDGGTVRSYGGWFNVAAWGGTAHIQLNDGYLRYDGSQFHIGTGGTIDLVDGKLAVAGDLTNDATWGDIIGGWVFSGNITGYGGTGTVVYDYDVTNPGYTTVWAVPEPATFGLVGLMGGGLLWVRKRFTI